MKSSMPDYRFKLHCLFRKVLNVGFGLVAVFCLLVGEAQSQTPTSMADTEILQTTQRWLDQAVSTARTSGSSALRMEVTLGTIDSRLRLAPCGRVDPFLPAGNRLWGRTRMGLRCTDGVSKWSVFVPVTVKALGVAWVIKGNIATGTPLTLEDVMEAEVDWAEEAGAVVIDPALWVGQVATRGLVTGQVLRQGMFRPAQVFQAGAQVRVVAQGVGFHITSDGQALSVGVIGQSARVKMENGRIMSGVVLDTRTVKIDI